MSGAAEITTYNTPKLNLKWKVFSLNPTYYKIKTPKLYFNNNNKARCAGSDGSMPASGSAGPGFDPRQGSKFSFENFQSRS